MPPQAVLRHSRGQGTLVDSDLVWGLGEEG